MLSKILIAGALLFPGIARADWHEASSDHFVVYADDTPEHIRAFSTKMEKYDRAMLMLRGVPTQVRAPASRVTVFMDGSLDDIRRLYGQGGNVAGFYMPRASGSVAFVPRTSIDSGTLSINQVLLHEYAHHFMYNDWPTALFPRWFSEGFAEFHSTAIFGKDGSVTFGAPPLDRRYGVTMVSQMPLSKMLRPDLAKLDGMQTYALYSRGWLLTHFLTFDPARRKQLSDYVTAINDGKSAEEASAIFGNLNALDLKLTSYVKRPSFQSAIIPALDLAIGTVNVRALTPGEAATMRARIQSQRGVDEAGAQRVVATARTTAAPFPSDPGAQNVLAEAEYDAKNYAAAEAAADRALSADPGSVHALLYKGMALQASAVKTNATDPKQWAAVRKWYLAANKIDAQDPQPLILFYESFAAARQPATKNAEDALLFAQKLAPFEYDLRYTAAKIQLKRGKPEEARRELRMIAFLPHGGEAADRANKAIAVLDKDGAAAALALIETSEKEASEKAKKAGTAKAGGNQD